MAITAVDKLKLNKYLREHSADDIYYLGMCDSLGKRDKISDVEFLEYFTDLAVVTLNQSEKISIKHMTKIIIVLESFVGWVHESKHAIQDEILDKIRSLDELYENYVSRTGNAKDENLYNNYICSLKKKINHFYPDNNRGESITKYINKIGELEKKVAILQKELESATKLKIQLQKDNDKQSGKIENLNKEIATLTNQIEKKEKDISKLTASITELTNNILSLEKELDGIKQENSVLLPYKEKYEQLLKEKERLDKIIQEEASIKEAISQHETKKAQLQGLIYKKLLIERSSLDDIQKYIQKNGITSNKQELLEALKELRRNINIDNSYFSNQLAYKVMPPRVLEDNIFRVNLPNECKSYDIILVSDFHIKEFNHRVLSGFEMLNEYCVQNGINLILNLGDFYHGLCGRTLDYENAIKNIKIVEQSVDFIPRVEGIYHGILGGNHEQNIVNYGIDPLEFLSTEREDIINLGYNHATIELGDSEKTLGQFDIHHPSTFDLPKGLDGDLTIMDSYLDNVYERQNRQRNNSYLDIFGHIHSNVFNFPKSYCYIAPFFEDRMKSSAHHLKIYFNENNDIEYMQFMPLSSTPSHKLIKNSEIIYQKVLKK